LCAHGTADASVPYVSVERFCAKAKELGRRCEVIGHEGAEHGFFNPKNADGQWYRQTVLEMDRFLASIGYLSNSAPR
jgi:acetyl esterase